VLDRNPYELLMLIEINGRRFARRADDYDTVRTFRGVPIDEAPETLEVEPTVFMHRRDDRNQTASNHALGFIGKVRDFNPFGARP
jgi:hypothetical protein